MQHLMLMGIELAPCIFYLVGIDVDSRWQCLSLGTLPLVPMAKKIPMALPGEALLPPPPPGRLYSVNSLQQHPRLILYEDAGTFSGMYLKTVFICSSYMLHWIQPATEL